MKRRRRRNTNWVQPNRKIVQRFHTRETMGTRWEAHGCAGWSGDGYWRRRRSPALVVQQQVPMGELKQQKGRDLWGKLLGGLLLKKLSTGTREEVFQVLSHFLSKIKIKLFLWIESGWLLLEENKQNKRIPMMNYCLQQRVLFMKSQPNVLSRQENRKWQHN